MDDLIRDLIEKEYQPEHMELINESHKHAGHAGDDGSGQTHYKLIVVSKKFTESSRIDAQRSVLSTLEKAFEQGLHAISLNLTAPQN